MQHMFKLLLLSLLVALPAISGDWPYFRGPDRNGTVNPGLLKLDKPFGFKVDWKRDLGSGYSTLCIVGNTGVTMFSDGTNDIVAAFDTQTGTEKWRQIMGPMYKGHSGSQDGPTGSPTIDGDMVFALDPHGQMLALSLANGSIKWGHSLGKDVVARLPQYGFNTVPLVLGERVILMTGEKGKAVTAFDRKTGTQLWASGDDTATYQSPYILERDGKKHLLMITDNYLLEMDPADGRVIWQGEHKVLDNETYAMPLFVAEDLVLIQDRNQVATFKLTWEGEKATMTEVWRNKVFKNTYALPVSLNGYVYGFRAQFLHCINAATGETVWRSRPPGGKALTLVDGHLLIMTDDGEMVAVKAHHEGYQEVARQSVFDEDTYTPISVANGKLYVRNLKEMASISIVDAAAMVVAEAKVPELQGKFGEFVKKLTETEDKSAAIDAFMAQQKSFPIIEGGGLVHYVYRGELADVAVSRRGEPEQPLYRVPGTDLAFYSETLSEDGHWLYTFSNFGDPLPDALNPLLFETQNELRMPKWKVPSFLGEPTGQRGRLEDISFTAEGKDHKVKVYLPAGYDTGEQRYPVMYIPSLTALDKCNIDLILDNQIGKSMAPIIAVFPDQSRGASREPLKWSKGLVEVLIPQIDKDYRTIAKASARGISCQALAGMVSAYAAAKFPGTFDKVALQSFLFYGEGGLACKDLYTSGPTPKHVYLAFSSNDYKFPGGDALKEMEALNELLLGHGTMVSSNRNGGSPSWPHWRSQYGAIFEWFAPLSK